MNQPLITVLHLFKNSVQHLPITLKLIHIYMAIGKNSENAFTI